MTHLDGQRPWEFYTPNLGKYRTRRADTSNSTQLTNLLKKAFQDGGAVATELDSCKMSLMWENQARHIVDTAWAISAVDKEGKADHINPRWTADRWSKFHFMNNTQDIENIKRLARVQKAHDSTTAVVENIDMLIGAMLGGGMAKTKEWFNYEGQKVIELRYNNCLIEVTSEVPEDE